MDSVGQLTGGIAHDFNIFLTIIIGNLELMEMRTKSEDDFDLIGEAYEAALSTPWSSGANSSGVMVSSSSNSLVPLSKSDRLRSNRACACL